MSIATQSLKYGWVALATLTIGTATIFVAPSVLRRITLKDRIEVTLAIVERCLATQTGTNPATYGVDPPSIVRTWTDTNGASVIVTNSIAWRDDLSMKIELDTKLIALCPYYVDTNSVYDGTTNIIMHTFTGLLTSLDLGDHTNFTAIPAIGTNIATYGPWAWRNYVVAWQERYKVLNAMKMTKRDLGWTVATTNERYLFVNNGDGRTNYDVMVAYYSSHWPSDHVAGYHVCAKMTDLNYSDYPRIIGLEGWCAYAYVNSIYVDTNLSKSVSYFVRSKGWQNWMSGPFVFNAQGVTMGTNWTLLTTANIGFNSSNPVPVIVGDENSGCPTVIPFSDTYDENDFFYGWELQDITVTCDWTFNYCANKYW